MTTIKGLSAMPVASAFKPPTRPGRAVFVEWGVSDVLDLAPSLEDPAGWLDEHADNLRTACASFCRRRARDILAMEGCDDTTHDTHTS